MECPNCKKQLPIDSRYCNYCGTSQEIYTNAQTSLVDNYQQRKVSFRQNLIWISAICIAILGAIIILSFNIKLSTNVPIQQTEVLNSTVVDPEKTVNDIRNYLLQISDIEEIEFEYHSDWTYITPAYNHEMKLMLKDEFFTQSLSNQYLAIRAIFDNWLRIIIENGGTPEGNLVYIGNKRKEYFTYTLSQDTFKFISLDKKLNCSELDENPSILDSLDRKLVLSGTYGGPKVKYNSEVFYVEPSNAEKAYAWVRAMDVVKENLKAPSTAKFPFSYNGQYIMKSGSDIFIVKSYVDSQHSFGAMIRSNFTVKVKRIDDTSYRVLECSID